MAVLLRLLSAVSDSVFHREGRVGGGASPEAPSWPGSVLREPQCERRAFLRFVLLTLTPLPRLMLILALSRALELQLVAGKRLWFLGSPAVGHAQDGLPELVLSLGPGHCGRPSPGGLVVPAGSLRPQGEPAIRHWPLQGAPLMRTQDSKSACLGLRVGRPHRSFSRLLSLELLHPRVWAPASGVGGCGDSFTVEGRQALCVHLASLEFPPPDSTSHWGPGNHHSLCMNKSSLLPSRGLRG